MTVFGKVWELYRECKLQGIPAKLELRTKENGEEEYTFSAVKPACPHASSTPTAAVLKRTAAGSSRAAAGSTKTTAGSLSTAAGSIATAAGSPLTAAGSTIPAPGPFKPAAVDGKRKTPSKWKRDSLKWRSWLLRKLEECNPSADSIPPPGCVSSQIYPSSDPTPGLPSLPSTIPAHSAAASPPVTCASLEGSYVHALRNIYSVTEETDQYNPIITTHEGSTLAVLQPVPTAAAAPGVDPRKIMDGDLPPTARRMVKTRRTATARRTLTDRRTATVRRIVTAWRRPGRQLDQRWHSLSKKTPYGLWAMDFSLWAKWAKINKSIKPNSINL